MNLLSYICAVGTLGVVASEEHSTAVTIIGAGASGVSAAKVLHDAGVDFIMVEAKDTVGGRFQDSQFAGYTVEDGANWIHGPLNTIEGEDDNPLWEYRLEYDIAGNYTTYNNWKFTRDGQDVPQAMAEKWWNRIDTSIKHCNVRSAELWEQALDEDLDPPESIDISVAQCLRDFGYYNGTIDGENGTSSGLEEDVAEVVEWAKVDFEYAELPEDISAMWAFPLNGDFEYNDYFVVDQRGYGVWMDEIVKAFSDRVKLSETVTSIDASEEDRVTVTTKDGTIIVSDYALCTLPLGVLQKRVVQFTPTFSEERLDGIDGMLMGSYAKLYLQFETRFWGDEEIVFTAGDPRTPNAFPWAINFDLPKYLPGSKILSFHVADANARLIESQPIQLSVDAALLVLREAYGQDTVSAVINSYVTNWSNDPLYYGSYSDWPLGYTEEQHDHMVEPIGRLHFGGEHTAEAYGYGHGGIDDGREKARVILELIFKSPSKSPSKSPTHRPTKSRRGKSQWNMSLKYKAWKKYKAGKALKRTSLFE